MILIPEKKSDAEPIRGIHHEGIRDLPPSYDTLSLHHCISHSANRYTSTSPFSSQVAGSSRNPTALDSTSLNRPILNVNESLPTPPPSPDNPPPSPKNDPPVSTKRPRARKNTSWLSLLPFVSSISAKRVRQSVLSIVGDLVVPPSRTSNEEQRNVNEIFASVVETCAEHNVSLSTVLQEAFIADHTPMYWAIVSYRQELLVALLVHSRPLSIQTVSDIRRACLVTSNQALFHALRTCRHPFHGTDGIQAPSLRTASENLLLGNRPTDEICIQQASDQAFVVSFDIHLWQRRMKAVGQVSFEFIASSRMWSVTFFSTDPASQAAASGKSKRGTNAWHVMISLMESSPPTFFDSRLVVDVPLPLASEPTQTPRLREARSTTFPSSNHKRHQSSTYGDHYDGKPHKRLSRDHNHLPPFLEDRCPSFNLPPPIHPLRGSLSSPRSSMATTPPISIHLGSGSRQLGRRASGREPMESPTTRPDTWSDHGVSYTNAIVVPLGEGLATQLQYEHSRYLLPDGTLRGRLEARLVKTESSKDHCIIC